MRLPRPSHDNRPRYLSSVAILAVAVVFIGKGVVEGLSADGPAGRLHARASALCVATMPEIKRLDAEQRAVRAAHAAGTVNSAALSARYQADLLAGAELERRVADQIAALPGARSDAMLTRILAFMRSVTSLTQAEALAAAHGNQTAVQADAALRNRLSDANAPLAGVCADVRLAA
jgi:hypothetical protein